MMMAEAYLWIKAVHVVAVISWMAGLLYLPRLFVYHAASPVESKRAAMLKIMERRLLRAIMLPAMTGAWLSGLALVWIITRGSSMEGFGWLAVKALGVVALTVVHISLAWHLRRFESDDNRRSGLFFRVLNEVPTVLMIVIVVMVVVKPF